MTKLVYVERERAIEMLKAKATPLIVAKKFRCHVRTIERLKNLFNQIGTTPQRPRVSTRCQYRVTKASHLCNRFHLESVIAKTSQGTHNPKTRAQPVRNHFKRFV